MITVEKTASNALLTRKEIDILHAEITRLRMKTDIHRYSTTIASRHVSHPGNREAVAALLWDLHTLGQGRLWLRPQLFQVDKDDPKSWAVNVEGMLPAVNTSDVIIIAAHLDSTAERDTSYRPAKDPAPGADDDASGIAAVLAAARAILKLSAAQRAGEPRAEIRFTFFNAEELAQRGSRVYAKREQKRGTPISAVYHMDMIGYDRRGDRAFELHAGFRGDADVQAASLDVAHHMVEVCAAAGIKLLPQLYFHRRKKRDPGQGFSDHTSFHRRGFPAVLVCENFFPGQGPVPSSEHPNPDYHLPEDEVGNLDPEYAATIARAVTAAAWHRATRLHRTSDGGSTAALADGEAADDHAQDDESAHHTGYAAAALGPEEE